MPARYSSIHLGFVLQARDLLESQTASPGAGPNEIEGYDCSFVHRLDTVAAMEPVWLAGPQDKAAKRRNRSGSKTAASPVRPRNTDSLANLLVRQLRLCFEPFLTRSSATCRPMRVVWHVVWCALRSAIATTHSNHPLATTPSNHP